MSASRTALLGALICLLTTTAARADEPPPGAVMDDYRFDDGFALVAPDGRYRLRIGLDAGFKISPTYRDGGFQDREAFFVLRPFMEGNLFRRWIRFRLSLELAANPPYLLDAYVDIRPIHALEVRGGQQSTPFSRHKSFDPHQILFPDWSLTAEYFWSGHDKGATIVGFSSADKVVGYLGIYSGSPLRQFTTVAGNYIAEARLTVSPMGKTGDNEYPYITSPRPLPVRVSFTAQGYYGKVTSGTENFDNSSFLFVFTPTDAIMRRGAAGVDALLEVGRVVAFAEGYYMHTNPGDGSADYTSFGAWGQVGVLLLPRFLDVAARFNWINPSTSLSNDRLLAAEAQMAWYVDAPNLILKLRYGIGDQQTPGMTALGSVKLPAQAGQEQVITLQLNVSF